VGGLVPIGCAVCLIAVEVKSKFLIGSMEVAADCLKTVRELG
jgi:hypothetical protein